LAIFHLSIKSVSRGAGRSATAAAAYRAGERIRDERTGVLHNYSHRTDVNHTEILLPSALSGADCAWATQRASLWNAAEKAEPRRNARVAREYQVALPAELDAGQRLALVRTFARELAERHGVAIDLAVHGPRATGDPRNHHAHLLATSRQITALGLGAKAGLDMDSAECRRLGLPVGIAEIKAVRERWAALNNEAFAAAGLEVRVDHRSLRVRGIDREPMPNIPIGALHLERAGVRSEVAERIRERYRDRVLAREARSRGVDPEIVRHQAREAWLQLRQQAAVRGEVAPAHEVIDESSLARGQAAWIPGAPQGSADDKRRVSETIERDASDQDLAL
jgi:ATP-dependent exoDNAse (exonuclease V) alpha subunit